MRSRALWERATSFWEQYKHILVPIYFGSASILFKIPLTSLRLPEKVSIRATRAMIYVNPVIPAAVLLPLIYYLYAALRWRRFKQYSAVPQPKSSLIWGNLLTMHEQTVSGGMVGDTNRHPGTCSPKLNPWCAAD